MRNWISTLLVGIAAGHPGPMPREVQTFPQGYSSPQGYYFAQERWTNLGKIIPVCWENGTPADAGLRSKVRDAAVNTWESVSAVRFAGWNACASNSKGIRIQIADAHPHVKALGKALDGMPNGMVLNFTFNVTPGFTTCRASIDYCVRAIAVHEFGHAIGLAHEQNRPDSPEWCKGEAQGANGDSIVGLWDTDSVMNYCNPQWNGSGNLSATDKLTAREMYGNNDIYLKPGNNGTSNGHRYCRNDGAPWGRKGFCVAQRKPSGETIDCATTAGFLGGAQVDVFCTSSFGATPPGHSDHPSFFIKNLNNGTSSCDVFCAGPQWGEVGTCALQVSPADEQLACSAIHGLDERGVLCVCKR